MPNVITDKTKWLEKKINKFNFSFCWMLSMELPIEIHKKKKRRKWFKCFVNTHMQSKDCEHIQYVGYYKIPKIAWYIHCRFSFRVAFLLLLFYLFCSFWVVWICQFFRFLSAPSPATSQILCFFPFPICSLPFYCFRFFFSRSLISRIVSLSGVTVISHSMCWSIFKAGKLDSNRMKYLHFFLSLSLSPHSYVASTALVVVGIVIHRRLVL